MIISVPLHSNTLSGFSVIKAGGDIAENIYNVYADIEFRINDDVKNALDHGVSLQIDIELKLYESREWIWDIEIVNRTFHYQLKQHPLSNHYLITDLDSFNQWHFQNLASALNRLGNLENIALINIDQLSSNKTYKASIMAKLNTRELPAPLRPKAYFSANWRLKSNNYEWMVKQ